MAAGRLFVCLLFFVVGKRLARLARFLGILVGLVIGFVTHFWDYLADCLLVGERLLYGRAFVQRFVVIITAAADRTCSGRRSKGGIDGGIVGCFV